MKGLVKTEGQPSKGAAIIWRQHLFHLVSLIAINDSMTGIIITNENVWFLTINVYLPCDTQNADSLDVVFKEQNINNVIVGDFNAYPNIDNFWPELSYFRRSVPLHHVDSSLPNNYFTYLCQAENSTSRLNHIFYTVNVSIFRKSTINILYYTNLL